MPIRSTLAVQSVRFHRNGSFGAAYYHLRFCYAGRVFQAVVFDEQEHIAVLDADDASWRYEDFCADLRAYVDSADCRSRCWPSQCAANEERAP